MRKQARLLRPPSPFRGLDPPSLKERLKGLMPCSVKNISFLKPLRIGFRGQTYWCISPFNLSRWVEISRPDTPISGLINDIYNVCSSSQRMDTALWILCSSSQRRSKNGSLTINLYRHGSTGLMGPEPFIPNLLMP